MPRLWRHQGNSSRNNWGPWRCKLVGVFREGHNKPRPRNRAPLKFDPPISPWRKRAPLIAVAAIAALLAAGWAIKANAKVERGQGIYGFETIAPRLR